MNGNLPLALYRAEQVRELDRLAVERFSVAPDTLMERAGQAAWRLLQTTWPKPAAITIVCGPGNNGGDGYVLGRLALESGWPLRLAALAEPHAESTAAEARRRFEAAGGKVEAFDPVLLEGPGIVVDALLGTGAKPPLHGAYPDVVERINRSQRRILALDLPSGLDADTGAIDGPAIRARQTISFIGLKLGLLTAEGPDHAGDLVHSDLGVPKALLAAVPAAGERLAVARLEEWLPIRDRNSHKGRFGHVLIVGGDHGTGGAVILAAKAALRAGAGLVSVATRREHVPAVLSAVPEVMAVAIETPSDLAPLLEAATVVAAGPGLGTGEWGRDLWRAVREASRPLVVDADALNLLARDPQSRDDWVLTPHPGEAARLLDQDTASIQADRPAAVQALADKFGGVTVLKGCGSLVGRADGALALCALGNPGMAAPGMGDALTGVLAGLLAQGLTPWDAGRAGVVAHARAGDVAAGEHPRGLSAGELIDALRPVVNPWL